jgi:hypothetical protein
MNHLLEFKTTNMEKLIDKREFQSVICLKDNRVYVYRIDENPCFIEDDYVLIKCFLLKNNGEPDLSHEVEIYGKYLVDAE